MSHWKFFSGAERVFVLCLINDETAHRLASGSREKVIGYLEYKLLLSDLCLKQMGVEEE